MGRPEARFVFMHLGPRVAACCTNAWLNFPVSPFIVHGLNSFVYLTETIRIRALLTTNVESLSSTGDRFNPIGQAALRYCEVSHTLSTLTTLLPSPTGQKDAEHSIRLAI